MMFYEVESPTDAWFRVSINGVLMDKYVELELYPTVVPKTVTNF